MKRDTLHTVNKWNLPAFMGEPNLFAVGGTIQPAQGVAPNSAFTPNFTINPRPVAQAAPAITLAPASGVMFQTQITPGLSAWTARPQIKDTGDGNKKGSGFGDTAKAAGMVVMGLADGIGQSDEFRRGLWDRADPLHYLAGGRESGVGNAVGDVGVGLFKAGAASGNAPLMIAGAIGKGAGSLINAGWGIKEDKDNVNYIKGNTAAAKSAGNALGSAGTMNDVLAAAGSMTGSSSFDWSDLYKNGWFTSKGTKKGNKLIGEENNALAYQNHALMTGVDNANKAQYDDIMSNYAAFGGPLDMGLPSQGGAIDYGFMSDYLSMRNRQAQAKNKMGGMTNTPAFMSQTFALGGDMQTNGSDFSTGLLRVDAGQSHELNPNGGVQLGVDQDGTPNLVEENETVFNNYVYSNRILADIQTKQHFHLPKKRDISFAEISKRLEKEASERPNDPISQAGLKAQMAELAEHQERQKQEMEAERARAAFEALSPEEQAAIMQQREQQQLTQQQTMQGAAEIQQPTEPTPDELAMQQQMMQADGSQANLGAEPQLNCMGGRINRFDKGGELKKRIYSLLDLHTDGDYKNWLKKNKLDDLKEAEDWENILSNQVIMSAVTKDNPALAHAISKGYDFGMYVPENNGKATIQSINKGNWKTTNGKGWRGSSDLAFQQATEGLTDAEIDALTTEQLAERMRNTEAYKNTSKWLENPDNALLYLNTLLEDPNTPDDAKRYAQKFVQDGKWKDGFNYDYATVFGSNGKGVRETNPGTYWHSVQEANRGNQTQNLAINEDGSIEPIVGDVPSDWTSAGSYAWSDSENDLTYNYYKRPVLTSTTPTSTPPGNAGGTVAGAGEGKTDAPKYRPEWMRYAGVFGPAVGLGLMAAGVGRPDTASLDAAIEGSGNVALADYKPLGNYLRYSPFDVWYAQNRQNANARATDRAILNSGANQGSRMAGLLNNSYNSQLAAGNLFRQGLEYNDALRQRVAEFNRGTDQFNADAYNRNSQFNASALNQARQQNASLRLQAAREKMGADAGWYNSLYGNLSGLFKGLSDIGTENFRMNRIAEMGADGLFGVLGDSYTGRRAVKRNKKNG